MILFKKHFIPMILADMKTQTRRFGNKRWKVGSVHQAKCGYRKSDQFANINILDVHPELLGNISEEDAKAEGFRSASEFLQYIRAVEKIPDYLDSDNLICWVVKFRRVRML